VRVGGRRDEEPRGAGKNPAHGVVFHYVLAAEPPKETAVKLDILGESGDVVLRSFTRAPKKEGPDSTKPKEGRRTGRGPAPAAERQGR
jgi:hypothetical protein